MPLSPMYPPRDRSQEVYTPPSEFKTNVFLGTLWFGLGTFLALTSGSLTKALPRWAVAAAFWLNAGAIKAGWKKSLRVSMMLGWAAIVLAGSWLTR